jgi:hypothetical protein
MQVTDAKYDRWGELVLLVDQIPPLETLRFRKLRVDDPAGLPHGRGHLYVAEQDGYVDIFFQLDPDHGWYGQGYDGREFPIRLEDGTAETLVGPWSVGTDLVNHYLPELAARPVGLTDNRRDFEAGTRGVAGAITASLCDEVTERLQPTRPLQWLRQRHETVAAQLSATRPVPGNRARAFEDSAAHQQWVTDNAGLLAEEALLLREIAARTSEVAAAAPHRSDIVPALAEILPALRQGSTTLSPSTLEKIGIYHASYAEPIQTVAEVLHVAVVPGTTRYRELASIANDLGAALEATADAEEALHAWWTSQVEPEAPGLEKGHPTYQEYVEHGVFAAYGRRTHGPASSLDDHYVGPFGDDWANGEPAYDIGPSGTDEEHYSELAQYRLWLLARGLRALEAAGLKAIPHGTAAADVDRLLAADFGPWLLDRDDPAIRAAATLGDGRLAPSLFNTPDTQWVLAIADDELRHLGLLDRSLAVPRPSEAGSSHPAAPWVPGDVDQLLAVARQPGGSAALAAQARSANTGALLAWVEQARLPQPAPPDWLDLEVEISREVADSRRGHQREERVVLRGLEEELKEAGPRWWPGTWRHRADLHARIATRSQVVQRLDAEVAQTDAAAGRVARQARATREAWDASHAAVIDRAAVAVDELQRREDLLLDGYLRDPPQHLLEAIGAPPPAPADQQAWRERARQVERAYAAGVATHELAPSLIGRHDPDDEREPESDSVATWRDWHQPRRDSHGEIDRQHAPEPWPDQLERGVDF